jgi:phage tail sheath protein FI
MPVAVSYPGVYIEEVPSGVRTITGVSTSIGLFIGWASKGATDRAVRITNFSDYEREFGGLDTRSLLGYSVRHFFDNGGTDAYIIRIVNTTTDLVADPPVMPAVAASAEIVASELVVLASSPGEWANTLSILTTHRVDATDRFRIDVVNADGVVLESFANLSMNADDLRFPPNVINERARLISVTVTAPVAPALPVTPSDGSIQLNTTTAGDDGTVLTPNSVDFNDAVLANFGDESITNQIDVFNIVCVPGETDATTLGLLQGHCRERRAFLITDSPEDETFTNMRTSGTSGLTGVNATNAALFYPWVLQSDPLQDGAIRAFPSCGFVAGIFARTDATRGVWKAPAGSDASINGAAGLVNKMSDAENGQLNSLGINCLRSLPVYGNVVWGARTLHGHNDRGSEWKYVPVRRTALFIEESLYRGTQWVVFEPNDEPLWAQIRLNVGSFMNTLFRQGAFQGASARQAYFVKCDSETTTQSDIDRGIVNILVGFAPLKPAEFVIIKLQQIAGELEV